MKYALILSLLFLSCTRMPQSPCDCMELKIQLGLELRDGEDTGLRNELNAIKRHCREIDSSQGLCDFEIVQALLKRYDTSFWEIGEYLSDISIPLPPPDSIDDGVNKLKEYLDSLSRQQEP